MTVTKHIKSDTHMYSGKFKLKRVLSIIHCGINTL